MGHDNWVKSLGLDSDGTLFVETEQGIRLFDRCLPHRLPASMNVNPEDLMKAENRRLYYRFLATLKEIEGILIRSIYDTGHSFRSGDTVIDAGARVGTFSAKISAAVGKQGKVIAIEPEPHNFALLQKNIEANHLDNVIPIQKALWSDRRSMPLYLSGNGTAHSAYCDSFYGSTGKSIGVEAETLDSILETLEIGTVAFIKMDVEGSEMEALKGMPRTLQSYPGLAIAAYHPVEGKLTHTTIIPHLEHLGFMATYADDIVRAEKAVP